jgi:hypothetical protein
VIDKSKREDGTFSREDFRFDKERDVYICPAGKTLRTTGTLVNDGETLPCDPLSANEFAGALFGSRQGSLACGCITGILG